MLFRYTLALSCFFFSFQADAKKLGDTVSLGQKIQIELLAEPGGVIRGMDFVSPTQIIFTKRSGKLYLFDLKTQGIKEVSGGPKVLHQGQGGLLDVRLHPNFESNSWVYLSYSDPDPKGYTTQIARAKLKKNQLSDLKVLFTAKPRYFTSHHFGSRIQFDEKGYIFFTVGDRGNRDLAQSLSTHNGKIIRLKDDGSIPKDNPFVENQKALPEIWSYGHRNQQGLKYDQKRNQLWSQEHGPRGGDEINLVEKGLNYGWPIITNGREYHGPEIGKGLTKMKGMEQPKHHWTPSIAPSGFELYRGKAFPKWNGSFFSGALALTHLNRIKFKEDGSVEEERLLKPLGERIRDVRQGPDDLLYLSTDSGKIIRLSPMN